jgi:hypothetical protein
MHADTDVGPARCARRIGWPCIEKTVRKAMPERSGREKLDQIVDFFIPHPIQLICLKASVRAQKRYLGLDFKKNDANTGIMVPGVNVKPNFEWDPEKAERGGYYW